MIMLSFKAPFLIYTVNLTYFLKTELTNHDFYCKTDNNFFCLTLFVDICFLTKLYVQTLFMNTLTIQHFYSTTVIIMEK